MKTLLLLLSLICVDSQSIEPSLESKPQPCPPSVAGKGTLCATYPVWEDRAHTTGRKIALNIMILPALGPEHAPDPIFVLAGGPGQAATSLPLLFAFQKDLRAKRDIVFVDQRGTGHSNPLRCELYGDPPDPRVAARELSPAGAVAACRSTLAKNADLRFYTTAIAMDDVNDVRQWLGYDKINIWGGSYGTIAAQVYLRRHGATVRSMALAGVAPVDELIPLHHAWAGKRAIDALFAECDADPSCQAAYPNLTQEFETVLERARKGVSVEIRGPDGKPVTVEPSAAVLAEGIRHYLYGADGRLLPRMIHQAFEGNFTPLVQMSALSQIAFGKDLAYGLFFSVTCSEHVPFMKEEDIRKETAGTYLGDGRVRAAQRACKQWLQAEVPPDVHKLVKSDVPVLLMSGERDSVTPPAFGDRVAKELPHSRHIVFPHAGHGNYGACGQHMLSAFFEAGDAGNIDVSCLKTMAAPKFQVAQ